MCMSMRPQLLQIAMQEPATGSIFVRLSHLMAKTDYQKALKYVGKRKDMERYRDMIDFLFAELIGGKWRKACFAFYNDDGPLIVNTPGVTQDMIDAWDGELCRAMHLALATMERETLAAWEDRSAWHHFRRRWLKEAE
jgi:hypothetical protein